MRVKLILPSSGFAWSTATLMVSPFFIMDSTDSRRPSVMWEMGSRPRMPSSSWTKAPYRSMPTTVPSIFSSNPMEVYLEMSCFSRGLRAPASPASRMESPTFLLAVSTEATRTEMVSPALSSVLMSSTKPLSWEMCSRPSLSAPMSTNAPKDATPRILPSTWEPTTRSSRAMRTSFSLLASSAILPEPLSTDLRRTSTSWPTLKNLDASATNPRSPKSDTWRRPSFSAPMSTKAPKLTTPLTMPL
mmetsp:Transcript_469/g.835  ORF Transcript_469/g.835 Transcript_469/m.835 type:complete len:245 (+) Transcript_469:446-1180(+)